MHPRRSPRPGVAWRPTLPDPAPAAGQPAAGQPTAGQPESGEALLFRIFNEIGIIDQLTGTAFERVLPHGLTRAQFTVLNHCVRLGDNQTPGELATAFQITRGTLTGTLARLEAKGFITLVADARDGRSKRVLLTATGRAAREASIAAAWPLLGQSLAALEPPEFHQLLPLLEKLRVWLDANRTPPDTS